MFLVCFKILFFWKLSSKNGRFRRPFKPSTSRALRLLGLCKYSLLGLVFKFEPRPNFLGMENFSCKVYWFQYSAVVCQKQRAPKEYILKTISLLKILLNIGLF